MGGHFYLDDPGSELGFFPVPEEEYLTGIFRVAKKHGLKITDREILEELNLKKIKKNAGKIKKTNLYIDGTNLFAGQNELFGPEKTLDFPSLIKEIKKNFSINKIYFYASYIGKVNLRNKKLRDLVEAESRFFNQVKSTKNLYFYKGHRSPTSGKEKGVDVHLAVDIVKDVILEKCYDVLIMSGDADLLYPLEIAKSFGAGTHAIFLPNRFSLEMAYHVNSALVLNYHNKFQFKHGKLPRQLKIIAIKKPRI